MFAGSGFTTLWLCVCYTVCLSLFLSLLLAYPRTVLTLPPRRLLSGVLMIGGCAERIHSFTDHVTRVTAL